MEKRVSLKAFMRRRAQGFSYHGDAQSREPILAFRSDDDLHIYRVRILTIRPENGNIFLSYEVLEQETVRFDGASVKEELELRAGESGTSACYMEESRPSKLRPGDKLAFTLTGYACGTLYRRLKAVN